MFTLAHELAHVWLGKTALSDVTPEVTPDNAVERWCNRVAAEFLLQTRVLRSEYRGGNVYLTQSARLSKRFARALVASTLEGRTLYRDAMNLVGISKLEMLPTETSSLAPNLAPHAPAKHHERLPPR